MLRMLLYFLALVLSLNQMKAGCEPPRLKTSNGVYYFYTERGSGQQKSFNEGDSIDFTISINCSRLTGPTTIYLNGLIIFSYPEARYIKVRLPGKPGHYLVTTDWDYGHKVTWDFDFIEVRAPVDTTSVVDHTPTPAVTLAEDPQILFNYTSQSFTVTGNDIIQNVIIHDLSGKAVFSLTTDSRSASLDFLPEGIYVVEIRTKMQNILLKKLVLN